MGFTGPSEPKRIAIEDLNRVTSWILWAPFIISTLLMLVFMLIRLTINSSCTNEKSRRRWTKVRNWLATRFSGGEFVDVYSSKPIEQVYRPESRQTSISSDGMTSVNIHTERSVMNEDLHETEREKDLYLSDRLIPAKAKGAWFNLYMVLLPIQVAFVCIIIVHNIYNRQYSAESCDSLTIINNNNQSIYYECRNHQQSQSIDQILNECNKDNTTQSISCTTYYYNPSLSDGIITILNSLILHVTLAKIIIRFIIFMRYIVYKSTKTCPKIFRTNRCAATVVCCGFLIIIGIIIIIYLLAVDARTGSNVITDMVFFAFAAIAISLIFFLCGLFQEQLYEPFSHCSYNVTPDPKPASEETRLNNNNDQTNENCFCCSFSRINRRENYQELQ